MTEELKKLIDSLPEGIVLFNTEKKTVSIANAEFRRLFPNVGRS